MRRTSLRFGFDRCSRTWSTPKIWALLLLAVLGHGSLLASHYAGAEFRVTWVSGENYTISERVYRDCRGIALTTPTTIQLIRVSTGATTNVTMNRTTITDITPVCPGQVSGCPGPNSPTFGIEEHIFIGTVSGLAPNESYRVQVANNARNAAITTLTNAGAQNLFIDATFRTGIQNSTPQFLNRPFATFCANQPAVFAPNGFDPDGDAIQYSITACRNAQTTNVSYSAGFSPTTPLSSSSGININSSTGAISFTPTVPGQVAVICVRADEYRNGTLIGSVVRDMQVIIQSCNNAPPVIAPLPNVVVNVGQTYCVNVSATDANLNNITLTAVSGIIPPGTFVQNTNTAGSATGTFCFTPTLSNVGNTYTVTINAQDNACPSPGVGSTSFNITVPIPCNMTASATSTPTSCGTNSGTASVSVSNGTFPISYSWTGPSGFSSSNPNLTGLAAGTYNVLVVDGNSCVANASVVVGSAGSAVTVTANSTPASCNQANGSVTISATGGTAPYTYSFNGGAPSSSSTFTGLASGTYTYSVADVNGCPATGTVSVGIAHDVTAPVISCPSNISVGNDAGQCGAAVTFASATATDDCGLVTVAQTAGPASGAFFGLGSTTVSFVAVDGSGNTAACSFTVSVSDNEAPVPTCPSNVTQSNDPGQCGAAVSYSATASDNCPGVTVSLSPASGSTFAVGTHTVTATATDAAGNQAACTFTVTVVDTEAPTLDCGVAGGLISGPNNSFANDVTLTNDQGSCGALYDYDNEALDNCGNVTVTQTAGLPTGSSFPVGSTTNTFVATDNAGNTVSCSFVVTVVDAEAPVATCPSNITRGNDAGLCSAAVTYSASASDNCPGATVSLSPASGSSFPVGTTTVTATATDASGNQSTCSFTVTVNDTEAPALDCGVAGGLISGPNNSFANDVTLTNDQGACGALYDYDNEATDNCPGVTVSQIAGLPSGSSFPVGNTTNTFIATDAAGNTVSCSFVVTVVDAEAPVAICPANIVAGATLGSCGANVNYTASATDNCPGVTVSTNPASGSFFTLGISTVTATTVDAAGNSSSCTFTVTISDNVPPSITCPANVSQGNDPGQCSAVVSYAANSSDNCTSNLVMTPASGSTFPVGTSTVVAVATDPSGNTASCTFTVTVSDVEAPTLDCGIAGGLISGANDNFDNDANLANDPGICGALYEYDNEAFDNCPGVTIAQTAGLASGSTFPVGTTLNTFVATDAAGNTVACSFNVTVVDAEAPVAHCQDVTVSLDNSGNGSTTASAVDNGSTDNCAIASVTLNPTSFSCSNVGANAATLTVTDIYGNAATCSATVTVVDNVAPVAVCQDVTVNAPTNGSVSITASQVDNGSSDACGIASISVNPNSFTCTTQGANTVTLTVVDVNGNSSTCTATVTVNAAPIVVSLSSPVDGCGYNVSRCCTSGTSGSGSGSGRGSGHEGSGSGNGDHGSGSGSGHDGSGHNGSSTGNHGNHGNCRISNCSGNGHSSNGSHGHGNCGGGNLGGGHGNCGGGHGHGGSGSGNTGHSNCGHDGSINLSASGGCGNLSYLWSTGATTANLSGLTPGLYVVTVTDGNGNTSTASITLTQASQLSASVSVQNVTCFGSRNGSVTANGAGGCAPYTYRWNNGSTAQTLTGLNPGTYSVTVTDGYGCTATASGTVTQPTRVVADAGPHKVVYPSYAPQACATLTGTVTGGTPAYNVRWTTRTGQVLANGYSYTACPTVTTVYYFRATDANGCSSVDSVAVCPRNISCGSNKVSICHIVPGRYGCSQNQCIPVSQVANHLSHGDQLGACGSSANCTFPRSNSGHGNGNCKTGDDAAAATDAGVNMSLRAFPNPTSGALNVELACQNCNEDRSYTVIVSDIYGKQLAEVEVTLAAGEASTKLDLSQFAKGVYLIAVDNGTNRVVERVVKQ